jgi:RHS repeat-associated protein
VIPWTEKIWLRSRRYLYDGLGTVVGLTDEHGKQVEKYDYDAWGQSIQSIPRNRIGTENKFRFTGEALDPETGLYYLRARYYDPQLGRFISKDPIGFAGGDPNLYRYVANDPTLLTDPSGLVISQPFHQWPTTVPGSCALRPRSCEEEWIQRNYGSFVANWGVPIFSVASPRGLAEFVGGTPLKVFFPRGVKGIFEDIRFSWTSPSSLF